MRTLLSLVVMDGLFFYYLRKSVIKHADILLFGIWSSLSVLNSLWVILMETLPVMKVCCLDRVIFRVRWFLANDYWLGLSILGYWINIVNRWTSMVIWLVEQWHIKQLVLSRNSCSLLALSLVIDLDRYWRWSVMSSLNGLLMRLWTIKAPWLSCFLSATINCESTA